MKSIFKFSLTLKGFYLILIHLLRCYRKAFLATETISYIPLMKDNKHCIYREFLLKMLFQNKDIKHDVKLFDDLAF